MPGSAWPCWSGCTGATAEDGISPCRITGGGPLGRCESGPVVHDDTLDYVAEIMEWWRRYQEDGAVAASAEERHDAEAFPARPAARPEGARAASPAGAARFRSDDRPLHGASMAGRFH